MPFSQGVK